MSSRVSPDHTPYTIAHLAPAWAKEITGRKSSGDPRMLELIEATKDQFSTITTSRAFEKFISKRGSGTNPPNFKVTDDGIYLENESDHTYTHISTLIKSSSTKPDEAAELYQAARTIMDKAREIFSKPASPAPKPHNRGHRRAAAREETPSLSPLPPPPTTKKLNKLSEKVASLNKTIVILKWRLLTAQTQKTRDQAHIQGLTDALQHSVAALGRLQQEHTTLLDELRRTQEFVTQLRPRLTELEALQTAQLKAVKDLETNLAGKAREIEAMTAALSSLRAENAQLSSNLSLATTRVEELEGQVTELTRQAAANATALARLPVAEGELETARFQLHALQATSTEKDQQIRGLREALAASTDAQSRLQLDLNARTRELSDATARISELSDQLAARVRENAALQADVERLQRAADEAAGLRPQLEAANRSETDLSARVSALEEDLRTRFSALEAATGISINAGQSYEDYLTRISEGRTDLESQISRLQQQLAGHTALQEALARVTQEKKAAEARLSTLTTLSERIKTTLGMTGTPSPKDILTRANATLEDQKAYIARLTRELDAVGSRLSEETSRHAGVEGDLQAALASLRQELQAANAEAARGSAAADESYRALEARFTDMQAQLTAENEALKAAAEKIRRRDDRLERELTGIESILGINRTTGEVEESFLTRLQDNLRKKTRDLSEAQSALSQLKAKAAEDQRRIASLQTANRELDLAIQAEREKTGESKERLTALTTEHKAVQLTLQTQALSHEAVKGRLEGELSTVQAELASLREELAAARALAEAGDSAARTRYEDLERSFSALQSELEGAKARILALQRENEALNERYSALDPLVSSIERSLGIRTEGGTAVSTLLEGIFRTIQTRNEELSSATKAFGLAQSDLQRLTAEAASDKETIAGLQSQRDKLAEDLRVASVQIGEMKAALALSTDGNAALEAKIRDAEARRAEAITLQQQADLAYRDREARQSARISVQDRRIKDLESEISALKGQVALAGSGNAELERKLKAAQGELAAVRSDLEAQLSQARAQAAASEERLTAALDQAKSVHKEELKAALKQQRALDAQLRTWGVQYTDTLAKVEVALESAIKPDADPNELCVELESSGNTGLADSLRAIYRSMQETKEALAAKDAQIGSLEENSRAQDDEIRKLKDLLRGALYHAQTGLGETEDQRHPTKNKSIPGKVQALAHLTLRLKELQESTVAEKEAETNKLTTATTRFQNTITDLKTSLASKESEVEFQSAYITSQKAAAKKTESDLRALQARLATLQAAKDSSDSDHAGEVASLNSQIDRLKQALEDSRSEVAKQEETLTNQQYEIEDLNRLLETQKQKIKENQETIELGLRASVHVSSLNHDLEILIETLTASYEEQIALQKTLLESAGFSTTSALQSELAAINQLLSLTAGGATASERIRQLQQDLVTSQTSGAELAITSDALIKGLQGELDALRSSSSADVAAAAAKAQALTTDLREQQVATLQVEAQRNALQEANAKLEAAHRVKVSDLEGAIAAQRSTIKDLEGNVSRLTTALQASEAARSKLETSTAALQSELEEAKKALAASTAENKSLKGRVSALSAEKDDLIATIDAQKHKIAALQWDNALLRAKLRKHEIRELERAERGNFSLETAYEEALSGTSGPVPAYIAEAEREAEEIYNLFMRLREGEVGQATAALPLEMARDFPIDHLLLTGAIRLGYEKGKATLMIDQTILGLLGLPDLSPLEGPDAKKLLDKSPLAHIAEKVTREEIEGTNFFKITLTRLPNTRGSTDTLFERFVEFYLKDMARIIILGQTDPGRLSSIITSLSTLNTYCSTLKRSLEELQEKPARIREIQAELSAISTTSITDPSTVRELAARQVRLRKELKELQNGKAKTASQVLIDSVQARAALAKNLTCMIALLDSVGEDSRAMRSTAGKETREALIPTKRLLSRLLSELNVEILGGPTATADGGGAGFALPAPAAHAPKARRSGGASREPMRSSSPEWKEAGRIPKEITGGGGAHDPKKPREKPGPGTTFSQAPRS